MSLLMLAKRKWGRFHANTIQSAGTGRAGAHGHVGFLARDSGWYDGRFAHLVAGRNYRPSGVVRETAAGCRYRRDPVDTARRRHITGGRQAAITTPDEADGDQHRWRHLRQLYSTGGSCETNEVAACAVASRDEVPRRTASGACSGTGGQKRLVGYRRTARYKLLVRPQEASYQQYRYSAKSYLINGGSFYECSIVKPALMDR